jgi:EmrB/QacA subfamily drug resistance transporter
MCSHWKDEPGRCIEVTHQLPRPAPERTSAVLVVFLSCAVQFMVVLDVSVVNVALPTIQAALGFGSAGVQWVVNGYGLAFAGFLLFGGRLADIYGLRNVVVAGLAVFAAASLVGGLAGSATLLVTARAIQGLGAAVLAPATLTLLTTTFPEGPQRVRAIAWWTAVGLAGGTSGNLLGGAVTQFLSWRWILLINVPIGAAAIAIALRRPRDEPARGANIRLDLPGAISGVLGLTALTYAITESHQRGWADPTTLAAVGVGAVALAGFVAFEARFTPNPLLPLRLLRSGAVSTGNTLVVLSAACLMPMWFFLAFLMQNGMGYTPLQTGLGFLPHTLITMAVGARLAPALMDGFDARAVITLGAVIAALGFGWQGLNAVQLDGGYLEEIFGPAILISVGGGLLNTPITATVTSGVRPDDAGAASGLMNTAKQIGGAVGLAVLVAVASAPTGLSFDVAFTAMATIVVAVGLGAWLLPGPMADTGSAAVRSQ